MSTQRILKRQPLPRRVVTGLRDGKSVFVSDGPVPNGHHYEAIPRFMTSVCWATAPIPSLPLAHTEAAPPGLQHPARAGRDAADDRAVPARLGVRGAGRSTRSRPSGSRRSTFLGSPNCFEAENPGMHITDTVDYDIVLDGEIWLELDDGAVTHLRRATSRSNAAPATPGATRATEPATMAFVLIGAVRGR